MFNQHVRRTKAFWNLPCIHGLGCAGHGIIMIFVVPLAVDRGVDLGTAALMLTIILLGEHHQPVRDPRSCVNGGGPSW